MTRRNELPALPLTQDETLALQARLWRLLARQAELYTMGESTSVPVETAEALLASIRFSLELYARESGLPPQALLAGDAEALLRAAEETVRRQMARTRLLYERACRCRFREENCSLDDTLTGIAVFFRAYDPKYFAAELPCDIDYQLCRPVPEELRGVAYLRRYLETLVGEDSFLRRFAPGAVRRVLGAAAPDHKELLVNLYEPVATAALGLTMVEGELFGLDLTAAGQDRLTALLAPLRPTQRAAVVERAASTLARRLELGQAGTAYLGELARALPPRMEAVLAAGGQWQSLFPAFS